MILNSQDYVNLRLEKLTDTYHHIIFNFEVLNKKVSKFETHHFQNGKLISDIWQLKEIQDLLNRNTSIQQHHQRSSTTLYKQNLPKLQVKDALVQRPQDSYLPHSQQPRAQYVSPINYNQAQNQDHMNIHEPLRENQKINETNSVSRDISMQSIS